MSKQAFFEKVFIGASLTVGLSVASAAAEPIGTLSRIDGVAVVSQGAQYIKGSEGMKLKEGDRLMVLEGGNAIIAFADGCQYTLGDNEVLTIGAVSACATPKSAVSQSPNAAANLKPAAVQAGAAGGAAGAGGAAAAGGAAVAGGIAAFAIPAAIGGVVIAGAAVASNSNNNGGNN